MNTITNNVIHKITVMEKSIARSKTELERYEGMEAKIKQFAVKSFGIDTFVISHPTIHYLKGTIKAQESKRDLLKECLNFEERQLLKKQSTNTQGSQS